MSGLPWVAFYPSDWLAGTRGMSAAESGIYITLIMMMYERGEPLAHDVERLSRLCGAGKKEFSATLDMLMHDRKIVLKDGGLWNERVGKEQENREKNSEKQRAAANKRWQKNEQNQDMADASASSGQSLTTTTTTIEKETPVGVSKKQDQKRGSRIGDFEPDLAVAAGLGLSPSQAKTERDKFRDYWASKAGQHGVKLDWAATWRNWCRTATDRLPRSGAPPQRAVTLADVTADLLGRNGTIGHGTTGFAGRTIDAGVSGPTDAAPAYLVRLVADSGRG